MAVQLLAYAQEISPGYEEDLILDVLNHKDQPSVIQKIEQETQQELAEFEAEFQRRRTVIENRGKARVTRIHLLWHC